MSTTTTDPRDVIAAAIRRMTQAGESNIMCARWIMEDLRKAGLSIVPVACGEVGELVRELREHDELVSVAGEDFHEKPEICERAASALESLAAENARLTRERDYAVSEMKEAQAYRDIETTHARDAEAANAELRAALIMAWERENLSNGMKPTLAKRSAEARMIERRRFTDSGNLLRHPEGEWVRFTDHQATLAAVTADRDRMVEALRKIDALDEAMGHDLRVRHAFEAVNIARAALTNTEDRTNG